MTGLITAEEFDKFQQQGNEVSEGDLFTLVEERAKLAERADDYPGLLPYVKHMKGEGHPDEYWELLETTLADLDNGMSDTMEYFAEFRKDRRRKKKQARKDRLLLAEAGDARAAELQDEIENGNLPRRDVSRMGRELIALNGALYRTWAEIQK